METKRISDRTLLETLQAKKSAKVQDEKSKSLDKSGVNNTTKSDYGVNLSSKAKDLAEARGRALEIARNSPDVRENKVAELRERIRSGSYKVDPKKVADGMMQEAIKDQIATRMHEEAKRR